MQLKKINPNLQKALIENDFVEANEMQEETFSAIKSGVDAVIQSPKKSGKTTTIIMNVIQKMDKPLNISTIETIRRRGYRFCYPNKIEDTKIKTN